MRILLQLFGGRGGASGGGGGLGGAGGSATAAANGATAAANGAAAAAVADPNYKVLDPSEYNALFDSYTLGYSAATMNAIANYADPTPRAGGYALSQTMNYKLENGTKLSRVEQSTHNQMLADEHPIGRDAILTRAAHADFMEQLGVPNYDRMSGSQLNAAIQGKAYTENKHVSAAFDASKNPFISGPVSGGREVFINIKAPAKTKGIMGDRNEAEFVFSPGLKYKITGAHFDGTWAYPRRGRARKRVIVDVEVID